MQRIYFEGFDFTDFWDDDKYALENYIEPYPTDEFIASIEQELGYKLPASYIELMRLHNGGMPHNNCFPLTETRLWGDEFVQISGIMGIGRQKIYSLCGDLGSTFFTGEGQYPNIGICICDTPSAGHDMVMLDYTKCGRDGEPEVVHVEGDSGDVIVLAKDFETFIKGLVSEDEYDDSEQRLAEMLKKLKTGSFSAELQSYFKTETVDFDTVLRNLFTAITTEKGFFALHEDTPSQLAYAIQFYLISQARRFTSKEDIVQHFLPLVTFADADITIGGYAGFFEDWFQECIARGEIIWDKGFVPSEEYIDTMFLDVEKYQ